MRLDVIVEGKRHSVEVTEEILERGAGFFEQMDRDMDAGWRMGPEFVEHLDRVMRAQVAAERLMLALESGNGSMADGMAGYILSRVPEAACVNVDASGEPLHTRFLDADGRLIAQ